MQTSPLPEPSDELLREAIDFANEWADLRPEYTDLRDARRAMREDNPADLTRWPALVIGYVTVAMRGGRR